MPRYISVESTIDDLHTVDPQYQKVVDWCIRVIEAQPAADVAPVRHGHWIPLSQDPMIEDGFECSCCGQPNSWPETYCPDCGAKMDGGDGDD